MSETAKESARLHTDQGDGDFPCRSRQIRTVGIIGAGVMGRGIAAANVRAGLRVSLFDVDPAAAQRAVREIGNAATSESLRGPHFVSASGRPAASVTATVAELAHADLVIEAVPENMAIKTTVLSRLDGCLPPRTIVASNASSIPIASLARYLKHPERLCGLHFCHPVEERPLVEVIGTESTNPETLQAARDYALALGKKPIVVRDSPGFLLNRVLSPYLTESLELLLEGASPEQLDRSAIAFGMPWGPLRQLDEFGIDVALAVGATLLRAFPDRYLPSELLIAMYKAGRHGCKSGGGFYATEPTDDDPQGGALHARVAEIIRERRRGTRCFTAEEVTQRLFLPMLLEATRALEETIVDQPAIVDAALRDGLGMTRRYRGLFGWANDIGPATLLEWLEPLQELGQRYAPTPTLLRAVANPEADRPFSREGEAPAEP